MVSLWESAVTTRAGEGSRRCFSNRDLDFRHLIHGQTQIMRRTLSDMPRKRI
jgi:hypothetical protein